MKDKRFTMRCDQEFLDILEDLAKQGHMTKSLFVEIAVKIFPAVVQMQQKLDKLIADAKDTL